MANTQYRQYQYCTCYNGSESVHASELNSGSLHVAATSFPCDTWSPFKPFLAFAFLLLSKFLAVKKLVVVVGSLVLLRKMISGGVIGFGYLFSFVSCSCMTFWVGSEAIDVGAYEIRGVMFDNTGPCSVGAVATSAKWVRILGHSFSTGFLYFLLLECRRIPLICRNSGVVYIVGVGEPDLRLQIFRYAKDQEGNWVIMRMNMKVTVLNVNSSHTTQPQDPDLIGCWKTLETGQCSKLVDDSRSFH
ncbi:hypothetical protein Tco_1420016 [Tanacetum coccineum]